MFVNSKTCIGFIAAATIAALTLGSAPASSAQPLTNNVAPDIAAPEVVATAINPAAQVVATATNPSQMVWPQRGEGVIRVTTRVCGNSAGWQNIAAANNIAPPVYLLRLDRQVNVDCTAAAHAPATTTKTTTSTAPPPAAAAPPVQTADWVHPLASGVKVRSSGGCFGAARTGHTHKGVDLVAASNTPIRAIHSGTIVANSYEASAGYYVAVDHGNGYQSVYMHLIKPGLAKGTKVSTGQTIGYVGATGDATGPHLHFEIHHGLWKTKLNPAPWMRDHGIDVGC